MLECFFSGGTSVEELIKDFVEISKKEEDEEKEEKPLTKGLAEVHLKTEADEAPVIKIVNSYIIQAMLEGASDIHMEPKRDYMAVRFRIDGVLYLRHQIPNKLTAPITARLKIISGLDISKKRIPQDGRVSVVIRDRKIDLRTSVFPAMHGENVVLRILDRSAGPPTLSELGFSEKDLNTFKIMLGATKGIILASGPTVSGKTTTIYSVINTLNTEDKNVMTIEDPIEYEIEGIVQSQVNPGVTFANSLRSILRQDPDIIYVGEIRDQETAEIAVRSALTGHLVLSTIHTNDAVGTITRLSDIGIEAGLIASVLNCSFAQRLVRKNCPRCITEYKPDEKLLKSFELSSEIKYQKGTGCDFCSGIGYRGRLGLFEILVVNKDMRKLIAGKAYEEEIMKAARKQGLKTLLEDGLLKATNGITTLEEIIRVTREGT
jgi:type II secretory ATPase GspE/PulE/Tfp pilus assembly ATPase PilB-like protein